MFGGTSEEVSFRLCGSGIMYRMPFGLHVCHFDPFQLRACVQSVSMLFLSPPEGILTMSGECHDNDILIA